MLVLFETPAGYAIFKLLDEKKLKQADNLYLDFESPETASKILKLKHFQKFADTTEALAATTAAVEGKLSKTLKKVLKKYTDTDVQDQLLVADAKLGGAIKEKLNLQCISNTAVLELMRCIRCQSDSLLAGLPKKEMTAMALGLAHSLSRYKLKFSPDKIDTMIVQAVNLLDDLDKELNNYIMRCREWYGWHFPELGKIVADNIAFVKTVNIIGTREHAADSDLSDILPEEIEEKVKEAAEISMGTEISEEDIINIQHLCDQVIEISNYRTQLYEYLKTRMMAMAPNVTVLVGDLVGARLIAHAGSLMNLAKYPASTIQILGSEKALFRALKTKKDTPKYGLIYHAQLIGQASAKNKGKMSRMLAAKTALGSRVDALGEEASYILGAEHKAKLEARLRILEEGNLKKISGTGKAKAKFEKYHGISEVKQYPAAADSTLPAAKRKRSTAEEIDSAVEIKEEAEEQQVTPKQKKKMKKEIKEEETEEAQGTVEESPAGSSGKKKKKKKQQEEETVTVKEEIEEDTSQKKKKKKKQQEQMVEVKEEIVEEETSPKKKKKKKKSESESTAEEETKMTGDEEASSPEKKKKKKKSKTSE